MRQAVDVHVRSNDWGVEDWSSELEEGRDELSIIDTSIPACKRTEGVGLSKRDPSIERTVSKEEVIRFEMTLT
jgi:hypothetical protein